jgi:hypothetical protein
MLQCCSTLLLCQCRLVVAYTFNLDAWQNSVCGLNDACCRLAVPAVWKNQPYNEKADVFSFGVVSCLACVAAHLADRHAGSISDALLLLAVVLYQLRFSRSALVGQYTRSTRPSTMCRACELQSDYYPTM